MQDSRKLTHVVRQIAFSFRIPLLEEREIWLVSLFHTRGYQIILAAEVVVERPLSEVCLSSKCIHANGPNTFRPEEVRSGFNNALPSTFSGDFRTTSG